MKVWPDKMALLTLGGRYGAAIKNERQDERGENAQGKLTKATNLKSEGHVVCGPQATILLPEERRLLGYPRQQRQRSA
jgi:hypothetical protein